jgi:hypothetical protein
MSEEDVHVSDFLSSPSEDVDANDDDMEPSSKTEVKQVVPETSKNEAKKPKLRKPPKIPNKTLKKSYLFFESDVQDLSAVPDLPNEEWNAEDDISVMNSNVSSILNDFAKLLNKSKPSKKRKQDSEETAESSKIPKN